MSTDDILRFADRVGVFDLMNSAWGWPIVESLHFIGLCLLIGTVGVFDLRLLGLGRGIPIGSLHRLVPFGVGGYLLNVATGTLFFISAPAQYLYNPAFQLKMTAMAIAGVNVAVFYTTMARRVGRLDPQADAPVYAKVVALVSLLSWAGVISFGRLLTFFRPPYHWCFWCS
ncbi:MAG: hypothetical protein PVI23_11495 [Maricaulaceae bacterium]|jgi:hypothetical protein